MKSLFLFILLLLIAQPAFASVKHYSDGSKEINLGDVTHYYNADGSYQKTSVD